MTDGPAALTISQLLVAATAIEKRLKMDAKSPPGIRTALDAIQRAIDTHPDAKRGDDQ